MRKTLWIAIGILAVLLIVLMSSVNLYVSALWFSNLGFLSVFWTTLLSKVSVGLTFGLLFALIFGVNVYLARRLSIGKRSFQIAGDGEVVLPFDPEVIGRHASLLWGIGIVLGALFMGGNAVPAWSTVLRYLHRVPFETADPIFSRDIGFYVFSLPLYRFVQRWLLFAFILTFVTVSIVHYWRRGIRVEPGGISLTPSAKAHLSVLMGFVFLLIAWGYRLKMFLLLYSSRGVAFGASYTDVHVQLLAYWVLLIGAVLGVIGCFVNSAVRGGWKLPAIVIGGMIVLAIVLSGILPTVVKQYVVQPNEITKEREYIEYNIHYTRLAYGLDRIEEKDFPVEEGLTVEDIAENAPTVNNIRLWDQRPLIQTYKQLQEMRTYYDFRTVDVDRYALGNGIQQVMLAARELSVRQLSAQAQTWVNMHLVFTHGYGLCMSPVNQVTKEGLPELWIQDIPPKSSVGMKIHRPEIYYGEQTENYVIVRTKEREGKPPEFDYPKGDENAYTTYQGTGGVPIGSLLRRLAFAWKFRDINILLTGYITGESRIMFIRQISQRDRTVAPFLHYDSDPYLVLAEGTLYWIQDAYTTTAMFPYAEPYRIQRTGSPRGRYGENINYIRNSVKVVIDAYNGNMWFYVVDQSDPLIQVYRRIFPKLFVPFEHMPPSLRAHIRYPMDLFVIQTQMYNSYHMRDPQVFYNQEDLWNIPNEIYEDTEQTLLPYYIFMRLPEGKGEEFLLMLPLTPSKKSNMVAWISAKCDPDEYGELLVYKLPKKKLIYGPMQIEARINQNPDISRELTLWGQKGSTVIRGNLLAIPINQSFIYVEPIYLQSTEGRIPEMKRVIVAYESKLAMAEDLKSALEVVFGGAPEKIRAELPAAVAEAARPPRDLATSAMEQYQRAQEHLKNGRWAEYGKEIEALRETLRQLVEQAGKK